MNDKNINHLLHKLASNQASVSERKALASWAESLDSNEYKELLDRYHVILLQYPDSETSLPDLEKQIEHRIDQLPTSGKSRSLNYWKEIASVACILLLTVAGTWYALGVLDGPGSHISRTQSFTSRYGDDVPPGNDKATLTLSDGQTIVLDDIPAGELNLDDGIHVVKTGEGSIKYDFTGAGATRQKEPTYHTITTPVGGEYQITLPDGSQVWLNSMSSITAPDFFSKDHRIVEITGEVFFDITEKRSVDGQKIPFLVRTANQSVKVVGTQFNIKAYPDIDAVQTTLVEGKVEVSASGRKTTLKPGEQSQVSSNGKIELLTDVNIGKIIAWKNGYFQFSDDSIRDIMTQLSRWYDINAEYIGELPESTFGGQISRNKNISEVLHILELTDEVGFRVEGKKVKVWKK